MLHTCFHPCIKSSGRRCRLCLEKILMGSPSKEESFPNPDVSTSVLPVAADHFVIDLDVLVPGRHTHTHPHLIGPRTTRPSRRPRGAPRFRSLARAGRSTPPPLFLIPSLRAVSCAASGIRAFSLSLSPGRPGLTLPVKKMNYGCTTYLKARIGKASRCLFGFFNFF